MITGFNKCECVKRDKRVSVCERERNKQIDRKIDKDRVRVRERK
jgi:hypothetical protein